MTLLAAFSKGGGASTSDANTWTATQTFDTIDVTGGLTFQLLGNQFFEETFGGDSLDTTHKWALVNTAGSGSQTFLNAINSGCQITTGGSTNNTTNIISGETPEHFDMRLCTWYCILKYDNSDNDTWCGISQASYNSKSVWVLLSTDNTYVALGSTDTSTSDTESDITLGTDFVVCKVISNGTNLRLFIQVAGAWVLKVTKTSDLPSATGGSPFFEVQTLGGSTAISQILYVRAEND